MTTNKTRRDFMKLAGAAAAGAVLGGCESLQQRSGGNFSQRPNILFIFSDDHAVGAIGAYGSRINRTPHIDRIASEGAIFANSFCGNSICAPSRATVLTGKHSHANGLLNNLTPFDNAQQTFPKLLQQGGYQTALIGKWHLEETPQGFDYWDILGGQGSYYNPQFRNEEGTRACKGYATDIITDLTLDWLKDGRDESRPFLMMCHHKAPHRIWAPGPDHLTMYDDVEIPEPPTLFDDYANRSALLKENEMMIADHMMYDYDLKVPGMGQPDALGRDYKNFEYDLMTDEQRRQWDAAYRPKNEKFKQSNLQGRDLVRWKYQRYVKDYLRCVASVDDNVGRLLDQLDRTGLAKDTIVVYSSDQGFYLGEHGWYDKRWMYEESLRMPLLMRWPRRIRPGTRIEALVQNIDYGPTFLAAAGLPVSEDMQGESLVPLLKGRTPDTWRDAVYYHYYEVGEHRAPRHEGVRDNRYKLIHYYDVGDWELFDLQEDPQELTSVYDAPRYAAVVKRMEDKLEALKLQYNVPKPD